MYEKYFNLPGEEQQGIEPLHKLNTEFCILVTDF
jgi:hypothetical protein